MNTYLLVRMLAAHLISDFILQPGSMAEKKDKTGFRTSALYLHILITLLILFLLLIPLSFHYWHIIILTAVFHFIIDAGKNLLLYTKAGKVRNPDLNLTIFVTDQVLHFTAIFILWLIFTEQTGVFMLKLSGLLNNDRWWGILICYIFLSTPVSVLIGRITLKWSDEITGCNHQEIGGLKSAGKWIGIIERFLIFTFIIAGQFSGVGFLLAAKSVFRFGDLKDSSSHMKTEYIIIGTLLSFSIAIFTGLVFNCLQRQ